MNEHRRDVPDGTFHHRMHATVGDNVLGFEWHGGAYIQVCLRQAFASPKEVINVWDYATDGPCYPRTVEGMRAAVYNWISNYGQDNLTHDIEEHWRFM